jgi:hypothetical protein
MITVRNEARAHQPWASMHIMATYAPLLRLPDGNDLNDMAVD